VSVVGLPTTPSFRLDGKRALVTGAGRGIGLAAAAALADVGAAVTLAARTLSEIEDAAGAIRARGQQADALVLDVTNDAALHSALKGKVFDILVNSAGVNQPGPFVDTRPEVYDKIFDLDMRASYFVAQAVVRELVAAKKPGSIINVTSQMGHVGWAGRTIYVAAKHALEGFTKALAVELAPIGIRVNALAPTFIETPMTEASFKNAAFKQAVLDKIKLGRLGQVEDLMGAIVFLASDASALMTGASLVIDGGWTAE
jgi:NAD(P)-dependent dehydrogenase (short-subunit alcohol dehydrogenase family)